MRNLRNILGEVRNKHDVIYKITLFLFATSILVYFFPKEAPFKYDFLKNTPWLHEDLIAPYDVPVIKSAKQIEQEKSQISEQSKLYYTYNKSKADDQINLFDSLYIQATISAQKDSALQSLLNFSAEEHQKNRKKAHNFLQRLYSTGVIEYQTDFEKLDDTASFFVFKDPYHAAYRKNEVYNVKAALSRAYQEFNNDPISKKILERILVKNGENIVFNDLSTEAALKKAFNDVDPIMFMVLKGQSIIKRGDIIDENKYQVLHSFKTKHEASHLTGTKKFAIATGQTLLVAVLLSSLALYLLFFRPQILAYNKNIVFLLLLIVGFVVTSSLILQFDLFNIYLVPICLIPLVVRSFFDARTAFFIHLIVSLLLGFVVPNGLHFVFLQVVAGMVGLYGFVNFSNRSQLFLTAILILVSYALCYISLNVIIEGEFQKIDWYTFTWLAISAFFTLLAYPLIFIFEKVFGFISDVTLLELANTNNKLLRELSRKAPGTFQHSLQVANLAEAAIFKIGGNALLMRTAALYHDIGKMEAPMYFIENQSTGVNPHDELAYEESAQIIISHVLNGVEIAKKHNIPDIIIDFIRTHHGTTKTEYFYRLHKEENPEETDEASFQYPGPIPFSKESAVLMMADSVEAASRSLQKPDAEKIDILVETVISHQMFQDQFINADITLRDITLLKKIFKKMLMNIYHVRVEYPH